MKMTIPYPENSTTDFVDVDIWYHVVATGGPPLEADFGIEVKGFRFVEYWKVDPDRIWALETIDTTDKYEDLGNGLVKSPYDDYIRAYIDDNEDDIQDECREFELTNAENMV